MQFENLLFEVRDQVAHLTFNRPAAMNAINIDTAKELMHAAIRCDEDDGIRAVIITGAGDKAFCAGGDLSGFAAAGDNAAVMIKEMTAYLHAGRRGGGFGCVLSVSGRAGLADRGGREGHHSAGRLKARRRHNRSL